MAAHKPPYKPGEVLEGSTGSYRLDSMLGEGGMSVVYEAEDTSCDRIVALKVIRPHIARERAYSLDELQFEARVQVRLHALTEDVVEVLTAGITSDKGLPYYVMERLKGRSLRADIEEKRRDNQPFQINEVTSIGTAIASVLIQAHGLGIIHRDIKPENLFLARGRDHLYTTKVLDFGISVLSGSVAHTGSGTAKLTLAGKPDTYCMLLVKILTSATSAASGEATMRVSLDGGKKWAPAVAIPRSGVYEVPSSGITLRFSPGTLERDDFYAALVASHTASARETGRAGAFAGSRPYAAPEQLACEPLGTEVDIYAVGLVLFELLTFNLPHDRFNQELRHDQIADNVIAHPVPKILRPDVPRRLINVITRCLRPRPQDRPTALQLARELRGIQAAFEHELIGEDAAPTDPINVPIHQLMAELDAAIAEKDGAAESELLFAPDEMVDPGATTTPPDDVAPPSSGRFIESTDEDPESWEPAAAAQLAPAPTPQPVASVAPVDSLYVDPNAVDPLLPSAEPPPVRQEEFVARVLREEALRRPRMPAPEPPLRVAIAAPTVRRDSSTDLASSVQRRRDASVPGVPKRRFSRTTVALVVGASVLLAMPLAYIGATTTLRTAAAPTEIAPAQASTVALSSAAPMSPGATSSVPDLRAAYASPSATAAPSPASDEPAAVASTAPLPMPVAKRLPAKQPIRRGPSILDDPMFDWGSDPFDRPRAPAAASSSRPTKTKAHKPDLIELLE